MVPEIPLFIYIYFVSISFLLDKTCCVWLEIVIFMQSKYIYIIYIPNDTYKFLIYKYYKIVLIAVCNINCF